MTSALIALALLATAGVLLRFHFRLMRAERDDRVHRARLRRLEMDMDTLWVSPNHQLPRTHISRVEKE